MTELACERVCASANAVAILKDVSFTLQGGSIVGLIGPNGSGKTTLLNVLSGRMPASQGEVRLDGMPLSRVPPRHMAAKGVFRSYQEGRLFESLTAEQNVAAALQPHPDESLCGALLGHYQGEGRADHITAALDSVGMTGDRNVPARKMSYGMRKRTVMGQAIAADARVYLLDEPLAGVDAPTRERMLEALCALRQPQRILVVVEHDLEAIGTLADRLLLMDRGRIVCDGVPREVLSGSAVLEAYAP